MCSRFLSLKTASGRSVSDLPVLRNDSVLLRQAEGLLPKSRSDNRMAPSLPRHYPCSSLLRITPTSDVRRAGLRSPVRRISQVPNQSVAARHPLSPRQAAPVLSSLYSWQSRPTLCLCYERQRTATHPHPAQESFCTQQVVASLQGVRGHSPVLLTRRSMFGARPKTTVQFRAYWIFLLFFRCAFFALKYAIGTTGFTVILRDTGRICTIFNEIFALTFATAVYFSLDNHN